MNEDVFGVQLNGTELGGVVGTIMPFGVLGLTAFVLSNLIKLSKNTVKEATSA